VFGETFGGKDGTTQRVRFIPAHIVFETGARYFRMRRIPLAIGGVGRRFGIHGLELATHALVLVAGPSATMAAGDRVTTESTKATRCSQLPFVSGHSDCSREQEANAPSA
jgi:hypothetical protein